jgi:hypothetical protein
MKAKLIFNLPEESVEFETCSKASDLVHILWELNYNVKKSLIKHTDVSEEYENGVNAVYAKLYELLDEYSINLDNLIG